MAKLPEDILFELNHYRKIRKIISDYNADYYGRLTKEEYFDKILETFPKDSKDFISLWKKEDWDECKGI